MACSAAMPRLSRPIRTRTASSPRATATISHNPLHLEGVPVISDELEAAHQFVSPAKYLVAWRRMSRSVSSLTFSVSDAATRVRNEASSASAASTRPTR